MLLQSCQEANCHLQDVCFLQLGVSLLFEDLWSQERLELLNAAVDSLSAQLLHQWFSLLQKKDTINDLILKNNTCLINYKQLLLIMAICLQFTLWFKVRWSLEEVNGEVIVGAMAGLCAVEVSVENLISAGFISPIYSPQSPYECVGLGLVGLSHSF